MKKQNKNFIYNIIYQLFTFLVPLLTIPYISRVLGADKIGIYSYTYSIVYYFMMFSMLGINNYGAREIAKNSESKEKLSKTFFSIYSIQLTLSLIMILLYVIFVLFFSPEYKTIQIIQIFFLLSCVFDINWFFFGLEEFKITVFRNIAIKIASLILIFIFVKKANDLYLYTTIMSVSTLVSQLYLWMFIKNRIKKVKLNKNDIFKNIKPIMILFIPILAYSIYRVMDKTMIGSISNTVELGFYENAEKIVSIPLSIVTALGTVMMPYMSKVKENEFEKSILDSFRLVFFLVFPCIIGLIVVAEDFSLFFFGKEFIKSSYIMIALSPTVVFGGVTNVIRTNYLIPKSKDKIYVSSTLLGAFINLVLNIIFIPKLGAFGACIGTIITEFFIMFYQIMKTKDTINYVNVATNIIPFILKALCMGILIYCIGYILHNIISRLIVQVLLALIIYITLNINYIKNDFFAKK